ncbi:ATP-binding protein [Frankia sp. CNm7]|uniref:ATP-binding protein n=1 Tax=Frankia nepalensis TaxID=1836974 RepID=A0A937RNY8_9ACTN|nr:ATP-binding protein [Frankia nepalensis]MBL7495087.1 ATP-binding protein [Frankia nepalensis]MBL7515354.1 ATP-binding protein [Frankia nepalensis]MBL7522363.1 ATP-binding protein [Frankia nepalensis]MBL7632350.1 ATP-binding protein [Frankia nepalensis]
MIVGGLVAAARFPARPDAVPRIRRGTVARLRGWHVDPAAVEIAEQVVAELASNAVKASGPGGESVAVRLTAGEGRVLVEVWDRSELTSPRVARPGEEDESGRGLWLVEALCEDWSWYRARSGGLVVCAQLVGAIVPPPRGPDETPVPLARRVAPTRPAYPEPVYPVRFSTDPEVLARVAERLRALDDWDFDGAADVPVAVERVG